MVSYQDPWEDDGKVWCYYDVTTTEGATTILYSTESFSAMEVDGVSQTLAKTFTFGSTGEHLVKFTLRNGTTIGTLSTNSDHAFREVNRLRRCYLPDTITTLGRLTFYQNSGVVFIKFSENITVIGGQVCYRCTNLANTVLSFPHLTSFNGTQQFQSCSKVKKVTNLGTVTTIPNSCIRQMTSLTDLVLPATVTSLVDASIYGNTALKRVIIYAPTPPSRHSNVFTSSSLTSIKVLPQSVDAYKSSSAWSTFASKIYPLWEETPIAINHLSIGDFRRRIMIGISTQEVPYPDNYVDDGWIWAYYEVTDTENPTELLYASFSYLSDFGANFIIDGETVARTKTYTFSTTGEHLVKMQRSGQIRASAFRDVDALKRIYICNTVTSLGDFCFGNSSNLTHVWLPDTITSIANQSFSYCTSLYRVNLDNTKITVAQGSNNYGLFRGSTSIKKVKLPATVTAIKGRCFQSCSSLNYVNIEELTSLTSIALLAFNGTKIKGVIVFPASLTTLANQSFQTCTRITEVDFGNTQVATIPGSTNYGCFGGCSNLKKAILPATLTTIQSRAFYQCYNLETIVCYATTPPSLSSSSFPGTSYVQHIYVPAESVDTYKAASGWSSYASKIEAIPTT